MYISKDLAVKLNYFRNPQGQEAITILADLLYDTSAKQCTVLDGVALSREQGKAQLALWLKTLPKGLNDAFNAASTEPMGQPL